jgi:hypothetical protein
VAGSNKKPASCDVEYHGKVSFVVMHCNMWLVRTFYCVPFQPVEIFAFITSHGVVSPWNSRLLCYATVGFGLASQ